MPDHQDTCAGCRHNVAGSRGHHERYCSGTPRPYLAIPYAVDIYGSRPSWCPLYGEGERDA